MLKLTLESRKDMEKGLQESRQFSRDQKARYSPMEKHVREFRGRLTEPKPREKCTQKRSRYQKRCEFYNQKKNQYGGEGYALKKTRGDILQTWKIVLTPTREHDLHILHRPRINRKRMPFCSKKQCFGIKSMLQLTLESRNGMEKGLQE